MKKLILTLMMTLTVFAASANSVRYFTRSQATRVAHTLDAQNELMIYCGYDYELATYVIVNEVWAERVNSKYYEIWLYGYDAYTGEEIYMPIDLACIWLYNAYGNRMYSAAQFLRFRSTVATPNFYWTMPPYNAFVRHYHDPHFNHGYTYHYEIHRFGWRPPMPPAGGPWPYHPYYMRTPHTPAPVPPRPFTPGVDYPQTPDGHGYIGGSSRNTIGTRSTSFNNAGGARSGNNMNNAGNPGTTSRNSVNTPTNAGNNSRSGAATSGSTTRSSNTNTGTSSRSSNTNTGTTSRSSNTNTGTTSRSSSTNTGTTSRSSSTNTGTTSRSSSTNTGTTSRSSNVSTGTTSRSSSANTGSTSRSSNVSTGTSSRSSNVSTGTTSRSSSANTGSTSRSSNVNSGSSNSRGSATNSGSSNSRGTGNGTTNRGSRSTR